MNSIYLIELYRNSLITMHDQFTLYILPHHMQVLSIGSHVKYTEIGTEVKNGVVLKHFPDKNQSLLVDKKNRKRRTVSRLF